MILNERDTRKERLLQVAQEMMTAARTAPKAKGADLLDILLITGEDIKRVSEAMIAYSERWSLRFLERDALNILEAQALIIIGTRLQNQALNCGYCGFPSCEKKNEYPLIPCSLNLVDVGVAIGAACTLAADRRVDSRVMFSLGRVVHELNYMPGCTSLYGIPISCSSKSPFFDRPSRKP